MYLTLAIVVGIAGYAWWIFFDYVRGTDRDKVGCGWILLRDIPTFVLLAISVLLFWLAKLHR